MSDLKLALKRFLAVETGQDSIHYTRAPTKTSPPYGVISIISNRRERTHDGRDGLAEARVQIDWFTKTDSESEQLSSATIEAVEKVQNETIGSHAGAGGLFIAKIDVDNEFDDYEEDTSLFRKTLDLIIQYEED